MFYPCLYIKQSNKLNHFISVEVDEEGNHWLLVHTGSRNFGYAICEYHQNKAIQLCSDKNSENYNNIIQSIEPALRQQYILTHHKSTIDTEYAYLSGEDAELYLNHMYVAQSFARLNHVTIIDTICNHMKFDEENKCDIIFTMHNYIEQLNDGSIVIRKGAVSAKSGQQLLIPLNMADGTLVCTGKGNEDWNCSAPHGAGRLMSRNAAKKTLSMDDFENSMKHVWSTCIKQSTIDEAPMAYKNADFIKSNIGDVVTIDHHLKPIYNFKAN
jgi:RNA-splicing ligase RtcB